MTPSIPELGTPERLAFDLRAYAHAVTDPEQYHLAHRLAARAQTGPEAFQRAEPGHFTASAMVVSADGERMLLMLHAKLGRWLQPGGHADGQADLGEVARQEAQQETGLQGLVLDPNVFDVDCHPIPAREGEPTHEHWDVRFVLRATIDETPRPNQEARALAWRSIAKVANDESLAPSVTRLAEKWLRRAGLQAAAK